MDVWGPCMSIIVQAGVGVQLKLFRRPSQKLQTPPYHSCLKIIGSNIWTNNHI